MYKILKIVLFSCVWFGSSTITAQLNKYIDEENNRILLSQKTEIEIQKFINDNFNNYILSQENNDKIKSHLIDEDEFTPLEFENAKINAKKHELRKLFFHQNPDKKEYYVAKKIPAALTQQCVNGDFENNTAGYSFWSDAHPQPASGSAFFLSCATPTALTASNVITPATNNFNSTITMIDNTSAGYQAFDPTLSTFGVNVPTLNSNGGSKCVKLNNAFGSGSSDLTTVSRYLPNISDATIDFNFSLIMDNKPAHGQDIQPYFRARVLDQFGNVIDEICIIANPDNCLFNTYVVDSSRRILYTGWICAKLNVEDIMNQPATVEFSVSDCQPSRHFGTVYIDNICGTICASPQLGAISLDPANINCPDVINNVPFQVCGTYNSPVNAMLNTLTLDITQNGTVIGSISAPTQLTATTFCFTVNPSLFGANPSGDFDFDVNATFNVNCSAGTFIYEISDHSANLGPDVTFENCCKPTLTLISPTDNHNNLSPIIETQRERSDWIKASNIVSVGNNAISNGVVYHAENFVELNPGFEADFGAQFLAYPEGCTASYVYKNGNATNTHSTPTSFDDTVNLIRVAKGFAIMPNPSSSTIDIVMKNSKFNKVSISSIDGKIVFETNVENTDKTTIDVSSYENGIYIINVTTDDGQMISEKLIKN